MPGINLHLTSKAEYQADPAGLLYGAAWDRNTAAGLAGRDGHIALQDQTGKGGGSWAGHWYRRPPQEYKGGAILSLFAPSDPKRRRQADWLIAATQQDLFSPAFGPLLAKQARGRQGIRATGGPSAR